MMQTRHYLILGIFGLLMAVLAALWVRSPGYMDADYYYATARVLASGGGLRVPFLWNYLASGQLSLPQPALLYWMPLTTFLAAASMAVLGVSFLAAQLPSLVFTAALPPLTAWMAHKMGAEPSGGLMAGGLAGLSGFYLPFFVTTDAFSSFAIIGGLALWTMARAPERSSRTWLAVGGLAGLGHLARADGLILAFMAAATWALSRPRKAASLAALAAGYLAVMGGWFVRMWQITGGPLSPGGLKAAWLTNYNQLFSYPADSLTPASWFASGFGAIVQARIAAAGTNLASLMLVNGLVFLSVPMGVGLWQLRHTRTVRVLAAYLLAEWAAMSVVFPFPGARGGFYHSSTAAMPLLWAVAPIGLVRLIEGIHQRRGWDLQRGVRSLGVGAVLIAGVVTFFLFGTREILPAQNGQGWGQVSAAYQAAAAPMQAVGNPDSVVAVNNPPGFWLATSHPSIVIPDGGAQVLAEVVQDFNVEWMVLEHNHPPGLDALYASPDMLPWLNLVATSVDGYGQPVYTLRVVQGGQVP
jgi:hypothetical protein